MIGLTWYGLYFCYSLHQSTIYWYLVQTLSVYLENVRRFFAALILIETRRMMYSLIYKSESDKAGKKTRIEKASVKG